jgi:hypothetical protein
VLEHFAGDQKIQLAERRIVPADIELRFDVEMRIDIGEARGERSGDGDRIGQPQTANRRVRREIREQYPAPKKLATEPVRQPAEPDVGAARCTGRGFGFS